MTDFRNLIAPIEDDDDNCLRLTASGDAEKGEPAGYVLDAEMDCDRRENRIYVRFVSPDADNVGTWLTLDEARAYAYAILRIVAMTEEHHRE